MSLLRRLFGGGRERSRQAPPRVPFTAEVAPDGRFFAVGDLHGQARALETLLAKIQEVDPDAPIVFVGDYVDRGDNSAEVLRRVMQLSQAAGPGHVCLKGNHEEMMLNFLQEPEAHGERWLRYGGLQTVASFNVGHAPGGPMTPLRDALLEAVGPELHAWLTALPLRWQSGNVAVVHAAADPTSPMDQQSGQALMWGHPAFERINRSDGTWVVHGHTIVDQPAAQNGRIAIDTGAYATGRLTAAQIEPGRISFLST